MIAAEADASSSVSLGERIRSGSTWSVVDRRGHTRRYRPGMVELIVVVILAVPVGFLVVLARAFVDEEIEEVGERLSRRAAVARRLPYHRALRGFGLVCLPLAALMPAEGFKGQADATAHAWRVLLMIGAGLLLLSALLLGLWWILAGRRAEQIERAGEVTFEPAPKVSPELAAPEIQRPVDRASAAGWGLGVLVTLGTISMLPIWLSPVTAVAGCYFGYRTLAALGALKPGTRYPGDD